MRVFLAFEIPREVKEYLGEIARPMARRVAGVKWVGQAGQHVTLKFFGEIDEDLARSIGEAVASVAAGYGPFQARLRGIDAFPDRRRARVIVVTLDKGVDNMRSLFNDIEDALEVLGIEKEKRGFTPHITLGRKRESSPLHDAHMPALEGTDFTITTLTLFKSTLTPAGALYEPLREIKLGGTER